MSQSVLLFLSCTSPFLLVYSLHMHILFCGILPRSSLLNLHNIPWQIVIFYLLESAEPDVTCARMPSAQNVLSTFCLTIVSRVAPSVSS
jgi:hypothetical protein